MKGKKNNNDITLRFFCQNPTETHRTSNRQYHNSSSSSSNNNSNYNNNNNNNYNNNNNNKAKLEITKHNIWK